MKPSTTLAFTHPALLGLLVTIGFGGTLGLGTVWLRHRISVVADTNAALEKETNRVQRQIEDTRALVEAESTNEVLRSRNERMQLGLTELTQQQIQPVLEIENPYLMLAEHNRRRATEREAAASGVTIRLQTPSAMPAPEIPAGETSGSVTTPTASSISLTSLRPDRVRVALGQ